MPRFLPDLAVPAVPRTKTLASGTILWRVHSSSYAPTEFNPTLPAEPGGGRFDATPLDPYAYLYAGSDHVAAVAETMLRDRPPRAVAWAVPAARLRGKELSQIRITCPLTLVELHGSGLSAVGQDAWLTSCGPAEYPSTRPWARAIRVWAPTCSGLEYRPRNDNDRLAYVLFQDRCAAAALALVETLPIDRAGRGFDLVAEAAREHNAVISLPVLKP